MVSAEAAGWQLSTRMGEEQDTAIGAGQPKITGPLAGH